MTTAFVTGDACLYFFRGSRQNLEGAGVNARGISRCVCKILNRKSLRVKYCGTKSYRRRLSRSLSRRIDSDLGAPFDCAPFTSSVKVVRHMRREISCAELWKPEWLFWGLRADVSVL